jgi:peptidoglycan-associated lipoprotein
MKNIVSFIAISLLLAACASTPQKETSAQSTSAPAQPQAQGLTQAQVDAQKLADELNTLKNRSVYFDFDKSVVTPEYTDVVQQQATFVKTHKNDTVTLEGNCDERGSSEYNIALGQRRAHAVAMNLELLGVPASQIKTISFGEEKPRATCHAEKCWKENRRVDFDHKISQQ